MFTNTRIWIQKSRNLFQKVEWFLLFAFQVALWHVKKTFYSVIENWNDAMCNKVDKKRWKMKDPKKMSKSQSMQMCFSMDVDMCAIYIHVESFRMKKKMYSHIWQKKNALNQSIISIFFCSLCLLKMLCFLSCTRTSCSVFSSHQMNLYEIKFLSVFRKTFLRFLSLIFILENSF